MRKLFLVNLFIVMGVLLVAFVFAEETVNAPLPTVSASETTANIAPALEASPSSAAVTSEPAATVTVPTAEYTGPRVSQIIIVGNNSINSESISQTISIRIGDPWDLNAVQNDINAITNMGFFGAVTYRRDETPNGIVLTYEVMENPKITDIIIQNPEPIAKEELLGIMKSKPGLVLNDVVIRQDFNAIAEYYAEKGYLAAVTEMADMDVETGVITIPIVVFKVGKISFSGNAKTKSYIIAREMETKTGDYYNYNTLASDYKTLYNLGFFESINKHEMKEGDMPGFIDIVIPVVEKKTGNLNFGVGYSSRQKLVGTIRVSDSNFRGTGRNVSFLWEQGTRSGYKGGGSWEANWTEPWVANTRTTANISIYNKLVYRFNSGVWSSSSSLPDDITYDERHAGGRIGFTKPLNKKAAATLAIKYDDVTTNPSLLQEDELWKIIQDGETYVLSLGYTYDTRDYYTSPTKGFYQNINIDLGHVDGSKYDPTLFSGVYVKTPLKGNYTKGVWEYRQFWAPKVAIVDKDGKKTYGDYTGDPQKDRRGVVAFRIRGGVAGGTIPFFEQFFLGGAETLRGYDEDRFWGDYMALANLEYRKPILDYFTLVAFADYGDAWGAQEILSYNDLVQSDSFKGHYGLGLGARFNTPIGNIRLDWGFGDEGNKAHFSMGHVF